MESGVLPGFFSLLAWAIFLGATAVSIGLGFVLSSHWFQYSRNRAMARASIIGYSAVTLIILLILLGAVISAT